MTEAALADIHRRMLDVLGPVDAIYHCPHDEDECDCRKPRPGMLERAARELPGVDLGRSTMVGDSASDMQAGRAVGARLVLIGRPTAASGPVDHSVASLAEAVDWLLT